MTSHKLFCIYLTSSKTTVLELNRKVSEVSAESSLYEARKIWTLIDYNIISSDLKMAYCISQPWTSGSGGPQDGACVLSVPTASSFWRCNTLLLFS
uniref:Uncharacterized protein n=1 Tax=Physcomitrium patens TaxID=3218 RepID=A0A7I4FQF1_PHYPA